MLRKNIKKGRMFWIGLFILNWIFILFYWLYGSVGLWSGGLSGVAIALGRIAGLSAGFMILTQFLLMSRLPLLEKFFGLDKLSRFHSKNGKLAFLFLLLHPLLLVYGYASLTGLSISGQLQAFLSDGRHMIFALVGLLLLFVLVASSIHISRSRLKYESWYFVHLLAYLAVFFSFWHQIKNGGTILFSSTFYWYWIALYVLVFGVHVTFRFIRPVYLYKRHQFYVSKVEREAKNAVSVYISGRNLDKFKIQAGQFMFFRFLAKGYFWQAHPFSLSVSPNGKEIRITVKELGDFTKSVKNVPVNTKVVIEGPFGVFTDLFGFSNKVLLIAGGIGITPIRSLMEEMLKKGKEVTLLYGNKTKDEIVLKKELDLLAEKYGGRVVYVLSDDSQEGFESGYIDEGKISKFSPDFKDRDIYVCGPPKMLDSVISLLKKLGVPPQKLHFEKFSL